MADPSPSFQPPPPTLEADEAEALLLMLRRKEKTWVDWGKACQTLQRSGYGTQEIFEATGFEAVQQNQVIVAAQVYESLVKGGAIAAVQEHFHQRGSDVLYELRLLNQDQRVKAAALALEKRLDLEEARELAKAYQEFARIRQQPEGFDDGPGDAMAHYCWRLARSRSDLQDRSRLIAQGLRFASSAGARRKLEQLLTDFTVVATRSAPRLPIYRLEQEEDLPRVVPLAGSLPLPTAVFQGVQPLEPEGPFQVWGSSQSIQWLALPGWQSLKGAGDPVAFLGHGDDLPTPLPGVPEPVVIVVDRADVAWNPEAYFVMDGEGSIVMTWLPEEPTEPILGRVIVVLRPRRILDEDAITVPWQLEE